MSAIKMYIVRLIRQSYVQVMADALLANETRQMRNFMDEILTDVIHEWEGDRNIIK